MFNFDYLIFTYLKLLVLLSRQNIRNNGLLGGGCRLQNTCPFRNIHTRKSILSKRFGFTHSKDHLLNALCIGAFLTKVAHSTLKVRWPYVNSPKRRRPLSTFLSNAFLLDVIIRLIIWGSHLKHPYVIDYYTIHT